MLPVAMIISMVATPGQTFGISTFNPYLLREFELSHSELSGAYMLGTLLASVPMIYVGALMDRYGLRKTLVAVVTLFGLACIGMSKTQGLVTVFFGFLFLRMLGQGAMGFLAGNTLAMWFNRRLGVASGIMNLGEAFAVGFFPPMSVLLIHSVGWRSAYATLGVSVWMVGLPLLALAFRNRPEEIGQHVDGTPPSSIPPAATTRSESISYRDFGLREAIKTRAYWILAIAAALASMIITGIHFHTVQIYVDHGLQEADAAAMFTTYAIAFSISILIGGVLADRLPLNLLLSASMACLSGGVFLVMRGSDTWTSNMFAGVAGSGQGLFSAVNATIWVRYYGRKNLGKIRGGLMTIGVAASSTGPFVMGAGHDLFGGYNEIFTVFLMMTLPMVGLAFLATRPARIVLQ